ncbi:DNA binding protein [Aureococcus anophagefferens]|nr:DNA binding protein [Aureococcus anophagefferens]
MYGVASLEVTTGEYDILWDVDWFDGHVNAVGLYAPEGEGTYAWGTFGGCLCKFYRVRTQRLDAPLEEEKPNNIRDDEPVFHSGVEFLVSEDLYEDAVLDVATVSETGGQVWIDDDLADGQVWIDDDLVDGSYLFRLGGAFEIFVGKIITGSGYPETYAVLESDVAWQDGDQEFGAAFTFYDPQGDVHVLFSSNQGSGVYELALPIAIPDGCWNTGVDTSSRAGCSAAGAQPINYIDPSDETDSNDGMDCPYDLEINPVQVLQVDDDSDMYSVAELDVTTGEYEVLWDIDWFDGHVNAVNQGKSWAFTHADSPESNQPEPPMSSAVGGEVFSMRPRARRVSVRASLAARVSSTS